MNTFADNGLVSGLRPLRFGLFLAAMTLGVPGQGFLVPAAPTIAGPTCFPNPISYFCPAEPPVADFNNDGIPDLLLRDNFSGRLQCRLGTGNGAFGTDVVTFLTPNSAQPVDTFYPRAMDLNGDGNLDVILNGVNGVQTLLGQGNGQFTQTVPLPLSGGLPLTADVGDLDGDGSPEVVYPSGWGTGTLSVSIARNFSGTIAFQTSIQAPPISLRYTKIGDLNGDRLWDIFCVPWQQVTSNHLYVFLNNGVPALSFTQLGPIPIPNGGFNSHWGIAVHDIDRDGYDDLTGFAAVGDTLTMWEGVPGSLPQPTIHQLQGPGFGIS